MKRTVLILASGSGKRFASGKQWEGKPEHKQLLDVGGETVIGRIIRQCRDRGHDPIVVTGHGAIRRAVPACDSIHPSSSRWIMETLYNSNFLWDGIVTALWGDVVYSAAVMDAMLAETRSPMFYGRWGDGFGMVFKPDDILEHLEAVIVDAVKNADSGRPVGRNWEVYKLLIGYDLDNAAHPGPSGDGPFYTFVPHDDYTQDIDVVGDYEHLQNKVIRAGRLDDCLEVKA